MSPSRTQTRARSSGARVSRRQLLTGAVGAAAAATVALTPPAASAAAENDAAWRVTAGRVRQSAVQWCFDPIPIEELARSAAAMGLKSVELVDPEHWPVLKKHGLACAISRSHGFVRGLNQKKYHPECLDKLTQAIEATGAAGFPNVITFSGMREGVSDEDGIANTVEGIKKVIGLAEKNKVTICLEPLNTRVDVEMKGHPGYHCDTVEWGVEVCKRVGSERMKILFDIYHVQIMQGDVIARIREFKDYIGHYHTAGVPGRHDLDDAQELNYPPIMRAIVETGYRGYVGQEFMPRGQDKIAALRHAAKLCDV